MGESDALVVLQLVLVELEGEGIAFFLQVADAGFLFALLPLVAFLPADEFTVEALVLLLEEALLDEDLLCPSLAFLYLCL